MSLSWEEDPLALLRPQLAKRRLLASRELHERPHGSGAHVAGRGDFGVAMSSPRDNPHGIVYEPWHWCHRLAA